MNEHASKFKIGDKVIYIGDDTNYYVFCRGEKINIGDEFEVVGNDIKHSTAVRDKNNFVCHLPEARLKLKEEPKRKFKKGDKVVWYAQKRR